MKEKEIAKKERAVVRRLITIDKLAEITATSRAKWHRHIWAGDCPIPFIRVGRGIRFDIAEVEKFLSKNTTPVAA